MPPRAHCSQALEQPRRVRRVTASFGRVAAATGLAVACGRESTKRAGDPRGWVVRGCSRHGAQLMGASGARCRGKACHGVANDAVAATNERRRHGRRALGRQRRAPCCHNATKPRARRRQIQTQTPACRGARPARSTSLHQGSPGARPRTAGRLATPQLSQKLSKTSDGLAARARERLRQATTEPC